MYNTLSSGNINLEVQRAQRSLSGAHHYQSEILAACSVLKASDKVGALVAAVGAWCTALAVQSHAVQKQHSCLGEAASDAGTPLEKPKDPTLLVAETVSLDQFCQAWAMGVFAGKSTLNCTGALCPDMFE